MAKIRKYGSEDIRMLVGLEKVRAHPTMYIGSTDADGLFLIVREAMDNVVDEFTAGRATTLSVSIPKKEDGYWIHDDGTGVPQGVKKVPVDVNGKQVISKMPTMQAIFGELHTSGKHSDAYSSSIGVHGVGIKGTNALSNVFKVWTYHKGAWHHIAFSKGKLKSKGVVAEKPPKSPFGKIKGGTLIYFEPDFDIFTKKKFSLDLAHSWAEITSFLNPGFKSLIYYGSDCKTYWSKRGPLDYLDKRIDDLKATRIDPKVFDVKTELADLVVAFTDYDGCDMRGFTNGLSNSDGGTHVSSVQNALFKAVKAHALKKHTFTAHEFKDGIVGLVNAKLSGAKFSSQAKVRLTDERMGADFETWVYEQAKTFFKKHKALALKLCERASKLNTLKNQFKASKKVLQELNKVKRKGLPAKYSPAHPSTKPKDRELILVEGDSASGGLKNARFPHQAILPLKGKIANALKSSKVLESEEVINILGALGFEPNATDPYGKLQAGKIICLADPDPDGPFVGNTLINIVDDGGPRTVTIEALSHRQEEFQVQAWSGKRVVLARATANYIRTVDTLVNMELTGGHKYKCDLEHKWAIVNYKEWEVTEGKVIVDESTGLAYKRAKDIRSGDMIMACDVKDLDKRTGKRFLRVSKCRTQELKGPVPVFCLTVKGYGNFVLPSGAISSNCHINTLLLTLFYRYMPQLLESGMVYVADAPEFYAHHKGKLVSGDTMSQVRNKLDKLGAAKNATINHIKGWGEVDEEELLNFALDAKTRKLIKIDITGDGNDEFKRLMNEDVQYRRSLLGI